jgi:signal transduction histidine kinase
VSGQQNRPDDRAESIQAIAARLSELTSENQRLFQELVTAQRHFRSLSRSVWRVQEDERRRLARELHDGIGQTLTALVNQLEGARRPDDRPKEETAARIGEAMEIAAQALRETRDLSRLLRPAVLDDLGLSPALRSLARTIGKHFSVDVILKLSGLDERFDSDVETLAYRVVQEGLTNVTKHSGAQSATVEVERSAGHLRIRVTDPGRGFDPRGALADEHRDAGVGLRGMRDRAELFGGSFAIESASGRGTRIEVLVPLTPTESEPAP